MKPATSRLITAASITTIAAAIAGLLICLMAFMAPGSALAAGAVYQVPASIDRTGATDASEAIQRFLGTVPQGTALNPVTVRFQSGGNYTVNHTLFIRTERPNLTSVTMWYFLPAMELNHVRIDLNGSTLRQTTTAVHDYAMRKNAKGVLVRVDRYVGGNPIISTNGATDVEIFNGTLVGSNAVGDYHAVRESWAGIRVMANNPEGAVDHVWLHHLNIRNTWGDWVYLKSGTNKGRYLTDVHIENNVMDYAGRQGIAIMGGGNPNIADWEKGVVIRNNTFLHPTRMLFDLENGNYSHVWIDHNDGDTGKLGYFWAPPTGSPVADHVRITNNHLVHGHFKITVGSRAATPRDTVIIDNNRSDACQFARTQLIVVGNFNNVTLTNNIEHISPLLLVPPFLIGAKGVGRTISGNQWLTTPAEGCLRVV